MRYEQSDGQSMVTSRSVPQQTAQIFSPLAGQKRAGLRFSQIGQDTESPHCSGTIEQDTPRCGKRQKAPNNGSRQDEIGPESEFPQPKGKRPLNRVNKLRGRLLQRGTRYLIRACLVIWRKGPWLRHACWA